MASLFSPSTRLSLGLLLGFLLGGVPGAAQLDTRLQSGKTDFMNLYQQATSTNAKPEIVTVFDYSGSMRSLMFHPLYRNNDIEDKDSATRYMKFTLTDEVPGTTSTTPIVGPNNQYTITATAGNCPSAYATYIVTVNNSPVNSTGAVGVNPAGCQPTPFIPGNNLAPTYNLRAAAYGNTSAYAQVSFTPASTGANPVFNYTGTNTNTGTKGTYTITHATGSTTPAPTIELSQTSGPTGTVITLTAYLTHPFLEGEDVNNKRITWSGGPAQTSWTEVSSGLFKSVATWTIPGFTPTPDTPATPGDPTRLAPITVSPSSPFSPGTLTFSTYFLQQGTGANNNKINWTVALTNSANGPACSFNATTAPAQTTAGTTGPGGSATWPIPTYCTATSGGVTTTTTTKPAYVTVTLDPRVGNTTLGEVAVPGITYLTAQFSADNRTTSTNAARMALIKPDGTEVLEADATATGALYGATQGKLDVRNWIRAASHVRLKVDMGGSPKVYRTIDIPIPWKITTRASTGNPLTSETVLDKKDKLVLDSFGNPVTETWGSKNDIEMDLTYQIENAASGVFTSNTSVPGGALTNVATKTAYLYSAVYRPAYISWLFNGKYQNTAPTNPGYTTESTLVGKYIVFDAASATLAANQGNVSWGQGYGPTGTWPNILVPQYNQDGTYKGTVTTEASQFRVPALTRLQATKRAAIQTWIKHQDEVFWAFRALDPTGEGGGGTATTINNDSKTTLVAGTFPPTAPTHLNGNDSGWTVLNNTSAEGKNATTGNSAKGMYRIATLFANGQTPLTYAMARSLAQFSDPNSVFNAVVGSDVSQCVNHFLLLFSDGVDNNGQEGYNNTNGQTPYILGDGTNGDPYRLNALNGNQKILITPTSIDRSNSNWNLFTYAGIGAHLADPSIQGSAVVGTDYMVAPDPGNPGAAVKTGVPSSFLPLAIKKRNGITYDKDHRITTMTVGVSLGGQYTDTASPKRSLFLAAVAGDPATRTGNLDTFHSFVGWDQPLGETIDPNNDWVPHPSDPLSYPKVGKRKDGAVFFFDATSADKLTKSLDYAFKLAIGSGGDNTTSSPNLPFVGASLGKQVYIGNFQPPKTGGVIWPGDLFMFGTRDSGGTIYIIDNKGDVAVDVNKTTALWAASDALAKANRLWSSRNLWTRLPGGTALVPFKDTGSDFNALKSYIATTQTTWTDDKKQAVIQNASGGDTLGAKDADSRPLNNRSNIMGDIINSSPAALEYNFKDSTIVSGIAHSHSRLSGFAGAERFRIILVGTNQGWLHAFGEVTKTTSIVDSNGKTQDLVTGAVDELWSFMPTEFLKDLDYVYGPSSSTNTHRFMVDGTPAIYLLDLPPSTGGSGNGIMDYNSDAAKSERAIAVFGLRKGGRGYYALDIRDPFNPKLKWSVVPDESASLNTDLNKTSPAVTDTDLKGILANMGFSSSTPGLGRIQFKGKLRDAVFLGGGFSVPEVEANFKNADGKTIPLGRSVMALDVNTGEFLAAADLTKSTYATTVYGNPSTCTVGPIATGLVPFEFFLNSGMAQRAYFTDYFGGLWAWGSKATPASTDPTYTSYKDYRVDSSDLADWTTQSGGAPGIRKVYHDDSASKNWLYSTLPAPFRVGYFRGVGKSGKSAPSAVGIALVSGDRNNPLDYYDVPATDKPSQHRLTVVFDRQDSRAWSLDTEDGPDAGIKDARLANFTANTKSSFATDPCTDSVMKAITPGCDDYYLAPKKADHITPDEANTKFGYYVNFPAAANTNFVSKGINAPIVIAGSLFYTYFEPTKADPCTGGTGLSHSMLIADVYNPLVKDTRSGIANPSGELKTWTGVSSDYIAVGTRGVIQGGTVALTNPIPGGVQTTIEIKNLQGQQKERYPKARVWRTVQ